MRKTMRELQDEKREQALTEIREKVADGKLTIRQMTAEECARYGRAGSGARGVGARRR